MINNCCIQKFTFRKPFLDCKFMLNYAFLELMFIFCLQQCINLFTKMNILNWIPEDSDVHIISTWLMLNLYDGRKQLACLLLKNMNWDYKEVFLS